MTTGLPQNPAEGQIAIDFGGKRWKCKTATPFVAWDPLPFLHTKGALPHDMALANDRWTEPGSLIEYCHNGDFWRRQGSPKDRYMVTENGDDTTGVPDLRPFENGDIMRVSSTNTEYRRDAGIWKGK
jgi:hypothetical protein